MTRRTTGIRSTKCRASRDQYSSSLPKKLGVDVLKDVKALSPHTIRILLTGYADLNAVINAINRRFFNLYYQPWQTDTLKNVVNQATQIAIQTQDSFAEKPSTARHAMVKRKVLVIDDSELVYQQMQQKYPV